MVRINPRPLLWLLLVADTTLLALFLISEAGHLPSHTLARLVRMNNEGDLPTWLCSAQLLVAGVLLMLRAAMLRRHVAPHGLLFGVGGLLLVLLSIDETAIIHESLTHGLFHSRIPPWSWFDRQHQSEAATLGLYVLAFMAAVAWRPAACVHAIRERPTGWILLGAVLMFCGGVAVDSAWPKGTWQALGEGIEDYLELVGGSVVIFGALRSLDGLTLSIAGARPDALDARGNRHDDRGRP